MENLKEIKTFEVLAGTAIREAIYEALELAEKFNCIVDINFNDIRLRIRADSQVQNIVNEYYKNLKKNENPN